MVLKEPLTFDEQVEKLKSHGVIIKKDDEDRVKNILATINYYRLSGYGLQFRKASSDSDYVDGITFDNLYKLYLFDEEMRGFLRKYLEIIEVYYKTQIAYGFSLAKCKEDKHDQHYDRANYYNKKGFDEVAASFRREKSYNQDSLVVKHHNSKYKGHMPLWVIVELMSFSSMSKLYSCMYISEQDSIATNVKTGRKTLVNNLHCLAVLRNKCAHAARLYDMKYNPPARLPESLLKKRKDIRENSLFAYLFVLIRRLPSKDDKSNFVKELKDIIERYRDDIDFACIGFPNDYERVLSN